MQCCRKDEEILVLKKKDSMNAFLSCPPIRRATPRRRAQKSSVPCTCSLHVSRRDMARLLGLGLITVTQPGESVAGDQVSLPERFVQQAVVRPAKNAFGPGEIKYPSWCDGTWTVESTLRSVSAPAGYKLFGNGYDAAMGDIGSKITYSARFLGGGTPDRYYNMTRIAEATLGKGSVLSCSDDGRNSNINIRNNDGYVYNVQLQALARSSQYGSPPRRNPWDTTQLMDADYNDKDVDVDSNNDSKSVFYASEFLRQSISLTLDERQKSRVREVETMAIYMPPESDSEDGGRVAQFRSYQRTAIYLPKANLNYVDTKGKAIDVRYYSLLYTNFSTS